MSLKTGRFTDALTLWKSAWDSSKSEKGQMQQAVANHAVANLLILEARLGRTDELDNYFAEIKHRPFYGSDEQLIFAAKEGYRQEKSLPALSFKCGPLALNTLLNLSKKTRGYNPILKKAASTSKGTNLAQVKAWADEVGLKYQMAKRSKGASVLVPSLMHLGVGHFGAVVSQKDGKYFVKDPTFGDESEVCMTANTIDAESDGYFLRLPLNGSLPAGWTAVTEEEAKNVWGRGWC